MVTENRKPPRTNKPILIHLSCAFMTQNSAVVINVFSKIFRYKGIYKSYPHHWGEYKKLWCECVLSCPCRNDRMHVTLDLDSIVQVLDRHLHDSSTGMMTRIAVLKWLYHLYIKTPRKVRTMWTDL